MWTQAQHLPFALQQQLGSLGQDQTSQAPMPSAQPEVLVCRSAAQDGAPDVMLWGHPQSLVLAVKLQREHPCLKSVKLGCKQGKDERNAKTVWPSGVPAAWAHLHVSAARTAFCKQTAS